MWLLNTGWLSLECARLLRQSARSRSIPQLLPSFRWMKWSLGWWRLSPCLDQVILYYHQEYTYFNHLDQTSGNSAYFERISDQAVAELSSYCKSSKPEEDSRFSKLLIRLSSLRSIQPDVLEEIFFSGLIGNEQIETVIPFALTMDRAYHKLTV